METSHLIRNPDGEQLIPTAHEVERGLAFVLRSYIFLFLLTGCALVYVASITWEGWESAQRRFGENAELIRDGLVGLMCLTGGLGYLLLIVGQWICMARVTSHQNAKETAFVCLIGFLLATLFHITSVIVGGLPAYLSWEPGLRNLPYFVTHHPAFTLKLVGLGILLFWFCCFNHFLALLGSFFAPPEALRKTDKYLVYLCGLFGGTAGVVLFADRFAWRDFAVAVLVGGWVVCLTWHVCRLQSVRSHIRDGLRQYRVRQELAGSTVTLVNTPQKLSGVRRVLEAMNKKLAEVPAVGSAPGTPARPAQR